MKEKFIGFDIGGTKIFQSVVEIDFGRRKFEFLDSNIIKNPVNAESIKELMTDYCLASQKKFDTDKVVISTSKIVDFEKQKVFKGSVIYGQEEFDFNFLKKNKFQVVLENDGRSFALGSFYFADNEDVEGLLTLTLGSGIGGGFIGLDGQALRGKDNVATEFSHIRMSIDGEWERWEDISAGRGIEKMYLEKTGNRKIAKEIFQEAENSEETQAIIEKAQEYLGFGIANLINIFNPEKIVFGGSIVAQKVFLERSLEISQRGVFDKKVFPGWVVSELNAEMNVLGVCALYYV